MINLEKSSKPTQQVTRKEAGFLSWVSVFLFGSLAVMVLSSPSYYQWFYLESSGAWLGAALLVVAVGYLVGLNLMARKGVLLNNFKFLLLVSTTVIPALIFLLAPSFLT